MIYKKKAGLLEIYMQGSADDIIKLRKALLNGDKQDTAQQTDTLATIKAQQKFNEMLNKYNFRLWR